MVKCFHITHNQRGNYIMKKQKKSSTQMYMESLRIPVAPPSRSHKSKKDYDRKKAKSISYE